MGKNGIWIILVVVLVIIVAVGYMVMKAPASQNSSQLNQNSTPISDNANTGVNAPVVPNVNSNSSVTTEVTNNKTIKTFNVDGGTFYFLPNQIKVNLGDTVRIVFTNKEGFHDLKIDEFNAATPQIQAGQTATIEFVADKKGTFEYYCSVGQHRQNGMVGKFIVE